MKQNLPALKFFPIRTLDLSCLDFSKISPVGIIPSIFKGKNHGRARRFENRSNDLPRCERNLSIGRCVFHDALFNVANFKPSDATTLPREKTQWRGFVHRTARECTPHLYPVARPLGVFGRIGRRYLWLCWHTATHRFPYRREDVDFQFSRAPFRRP